jgi:hypothetical protein
MVFVYCKENKEQTKRITRLEEELEEERKKRSGEVRTKMKRKNANMQRRQKSFFFTVSLSIILSILRGLPEEDR